MRALIVTDRQRSSFAERTVSGRGRRSGYGFEGIVWTPCSAGSPDAVAERLNKEFVTALGEQETKQRLAQLGANIKVGGYKDFAELIATDATRLGKVVKDAGARID